MKREPTEAEREDARIEGLMSAAPQLQHDSRHPAECGVRCLQCAQDDDEDERQEVPS